MADFEWPIEGIDLEVSRFQDELELTNDGMVLGVIREPGESLESFRFREGMTEASVILDIMVELRLMHPDPGMWPSGGAIRGRFIQWAHHYWAMDNGVDIALAEGEFVRRHGDYMSFADQYIVMMGEIERRQHIGELS